ncbi:unnamed protein product [Aphanomyces euteiches]|uniref:Lysosomal dipeptide transporter MFSD1 n=1 Tax=Aphanomyces euteiches TaxID=100861 RepID=A0A6G0X0F4_9STRA|nr:hypothetical protein Ae201684_009831 [Aphanomyces euteiches]KAH9095987.1 hypothetical protein Ae201684P_010193 [Aphanomyces euteiches]
MTDKYVKSIVLALVSLVNFGGCYCYDNPSALKSQLQQHFHTLSKADYEMFFNLLYSVYSVPNVVLPLFGGLLCDKYGPRRILVATTSSMVVGQVIVAVGASFRNFPLMLAGRIVFGLGGETVSVAQAALLALWFPASELAFSNGILYSVMRLATASNNAMSPYLAETWSVSWAIWFGAIVCGLSLSIALLLFPIDASAEKQIQDEVLTEQQSLEEQTIKLHIRLKDAASFSSSFWLIALLYFLFYAVVGPFVNVSSGIYMERDYFKALPAACHRCGEGALADTPDCSGQFPQLCPSTAPFAWPLPRLSVSCAPLEPVDQFNCSTAPPFIDESAIDCDDVAWKEGPATHKYCLVKAHAEQAAAISLSFTPILMAFLAPVFGFMVDHIGRRAVLATTSMALFALSQTLLGFTTMAPFLPLALHAIAQCIFVCALWPAISYCVEPHHVGTAYGILTVFVNAGLAIVPLLVVLEYNAMHVYVPYVHVLFMSFALLGVVVGCILIAVDFRQGGLLHAVSMTYVPSQVMPEHAKAPLLLPKAIKDYGTAACG